MKKQNDAQLGCLDSYILDNTPERIRDRYHGLLSYAQKTNFGVLDHDVVVLDTEATGLSFVHDELIQVAAARMCDGEIVDWYVTFVNPSKPIPDEVVHLTHITNDMVADAPGADEALAALVDFVGDTPVVAHNANFDRTFCTKYPAGSKLKDNIWIDSLDLARIALPRMKSHRLLDLVRAFGGPESTHRADDDVTSTCLVYRVLLAAVAQMPAELVRHIAALRSVEEWNTAFVFKSLQDENAAPLNVKGLRRRAALSSLNTLRHDAFSSSIEDVSRETLDGDGFSNDTVSRETVETSAYFTDHGDDQGRAIQSIAEDEVRAAFGGEGFVASLYPEYEMRPEQLQMSLAVNKAFSTSRNLAVEAGTGVGKSMAYLVPLAMLAKKNEITVGVATKTNALLDQLVNKELPLLSKALGVTYAPLKGFSHYLCCRKVEHFANKGPRYVTVRNNDVDQAPALAALLSFVEQTDYDDIDALKIDYRAVPRWSITTKSTECLRRKCPFFGRSCFVHGARDQAQRCDVVVTNHSLLFWDQRFDGTLLPPIRYWVVDEAHGAESEARKAFSIGTSSAMVQSLIRKLSSAEAKHNVLLRAERNLSLANEARTLFESLIAKACTDGDAFAVAAEEYCLAIKDLLYYDPQKKGRGYEYFDLWVNEEVRQGSRFKGVASCALSLIEVTEKAIKSLRDVVAYLESQEISSREQRDMALAAIELRELLDSLESMFVKSDDNQVRSVHLSRNKTQLNDALSVQPLDVGARLLETLYDSTHSVVYTSATLSVDHSFASFMNAMGLNSGEGSEADSLQVASSYNFDRNMRVFVPSDMPDPQDPAYLPTLQDFLVKLHIAQHGSILTLFTNRKEMESCFEVANPAIKEEGLRLVCQKWGVSVKGLRDDFIKDETLSLFALKSFWEGFDAPGSTLKGVVIPRLPFGLPSDPLSREREERDARAWAHYSLPAAVIDVKQAVGRLIRNSTDRGFVVLADHRLVTKYYGAKFLNSLPSRNVAIIPMEDIISEVSTGFWGSRDGGAN
ncbi:MAG: helicase C-terminal domain-containing protein [Coriobacteriia bacterium]|nr:helicase C-terminal domain-containing protein [Coriobacteriia bacterium]